MKTVIMAGGRGTRIQEIASDIPKPMIPVGSKPVLLRELESLRDQGFRDVIITVGHLGHIIKDYLGDGSRIGMHIEYYTEDKPLGNAGALYELRDSLTEDFLLLNGDAVFDIDFNRFADYHRSHGGLATILTHPNSHPYDSGLVIVDDGHRVTSWLAKEDDRPRWYENRVNAGVHILSPELLAARPETDKVDLDRQILKPLAGSGKLFAYDSPEYIKDMGTPERFLEVCKAYDKGLVQARNLANKQKAVFLDRDGTINKYVGFLRDIDDFELLPGVAEAIRMLNDSEYLAIVVSNQPVIARGEVTVEELKLIHNKMETLLGAEGAYVNAIYYCPHHPDKGFEGEIPELKIDCDCRKPKPGMLLKAAEDFNIDLSKSWIVGDSDRDVMAGEAVGCRAILLDDNTDLLAAVKHIMENDR